MNILEKIKNSNLKNKITRSIKYKELKEESIEENLINPNQIEFDNKFGKGYKTVRSFLYDENEHRNKQDELSIGLRRLSASIGYVGLLYPYLIEKEGLNIITEDEQFLLNSERKIRTDIIVAFATQMSIRTQAELGLFNEKNLMDLFKNCNEYIHKAPRMDQEKKEENEHVKKF